MLPVVAVAAGLLVAVHPLTRVLPDWMSMRRKTCAFWGMRVLVCLRDQFKRVQRTMGLDLKNIIHHQFIRERYLFALHHTFGGDDILRCINVDGHWALLHIASVTPPTRLRQVRMKIPLEVCPSGVTVLGRAAMIET
ncbi:MAG: hypothetical protein ACJASZ_002817 [Yoonia sp.]